MLKFFRHLVSALAVLVCAASANAAELYSFTSLGAGVGCTGGDYWINAATFPIGAGYFPNAASTIVGYEIWSEFAYPTDYVMIGHTPPNGDTMTRYLHGTDHASQFYGSGNGFAFNPATDELHIHYACSTAEGSATIGWTVYYTKP